jgi:hypothetical protein
MTDQREDQLMEEIRMLRTELAAARTAMEERTENWLRLCGECNSELAPRSCPNCGEELVAPKLVRRSTDTIGTVKR